MRRTQPVAVGLEDGGRGPGAQECGQLLEASEDWETDFPLEPLERALLTSDFGLWTSGPTDTSVALPSYKTIR